MRYLPCFSQGLGVNLITISPDAEGKPSRFNLLWILIRLAARRFAKGFLLSYGVTAGVALLRILVKSKFNITEVHFLFFE